MLVAGLSSAIDSAGRRKVRVWSDDLTVTGVTCRHAGSLSEIPAHVDEVPPPDLIQQHATCPRRVFEIGGLPADTDIRIQAGGDEARIRTLPDAGRQLRLVLGSCYYGFGGTDRDSGLPSAAAQAYSSLQRQPHLKILCGDQVYLDSGKLRGGMTREEATIQRYRDYAATYDGFLSQGLTVFSPDDHEFWNDYPNAMPWLSRSWKHKWREHAHAALLGNMAFQTLANPDSSNWFSMDLGIVSLFVTDLRSERSTEGRGRMVWDENRHAWKEIRPGRRLCSPHQLAAIESWASTLQKPGILVAGQPLFQKPRSTFDENFLQFPNEAKAIWRAVENSPHSIAVLAGDIHYSRAAEWGSQALGGSRFEIVGSPVRLLKPLRIGWIVVTGKRKKAKDMGIPSMDLGDLRLRRAQRAYATAADSLTTISLERSGMFVRMEVQARHAKGFAHIAPNVGGSPRLCEKEYSLL